MEKKQSLMKQYNSYGSVGNPTNNFSSDVARQHCLEFISARKIAGVEETFYEIPQEANRLKSFRVAYYKNDGRVVLYLIFASGTPKPKELLP